MSRSLRNLRMCIHPDFVTTYMLVLTNIPTFLLLVSPLRGSFPRRFLHPVYHQAQSWAAVLPAVCVQPARHPAAGRGGGPWPCLPVWGPAWQAFPWGVPSVPLHQPGWWQVSDWLLLKKVWTCWRSDVDGRFPSPLFFSWSWLKMKSIHWLCELYFLLDMNVLSFSPVIICSCIMQ